MKRFEDITIQALANNDDIQIGYSDNEIVVVDSIQKFTEVNSAHVSMNAIVICTGGRVQARMNDKPMSLKKNQIAIIPENVIVTDVMISPDFDLKAMFLTNRILQSFLREKMNIWNDMMYVRRMHLITMEDDDLLFYTHFYEMLCLSTTGRRLNNPYRTEVIRALLRSAILGLCGAMSVMLPQDAANKDTGTIESHFRRFLNLLHTNEQRYRTVEAYANELCISPKYLTAICKKQSGKTASEWIREQMLENIRYYLHQTDFSIKQVSNILGFPNPSFFGKYVKEHFGMTPVEFRNK